MNMTVAEKIRVIMKRQNMTMGNLADATEQTRQNLSTKCHAGILRKEILKLSQMRLAAK